METELDARAQKRLLMMMYGAIDAHKAAIETIIASHPRPDLLRAVWHRSKPEWIDNCEQRNIFRSEDFREGFVQTLSSFSKSIDAADDLFRPEGQAGSDMR